MKTIYANASGRTPTAKLGLYPGESVLVSADWSAFADYNSAELASAGWSLESGSLSIDESSESLNVSQAQITATAEGRALLKIAGTMADGQVSVLYLDISTKNPDNHLHDYCI